MRAFKKTKRLFGVAIGRLICSDPLRILRDLRLWAWVELNYRPHAYQADSGGPQRCSLRPLRTSYILIAEDEDGGAAIAEVYWLLPGNHKRHGITVFVDKGLSNVISLRYSAEQWAIGQVEERLLAWHREQAVGTAFPGFPDLEPTYATLADLWAGGDYRKQLREITHYSRCKSLTAELEKITRLPEVGTSDLFKP